MEIEQTARPLETNAHANFFHGRERSISMYGEWWGETCPHWQVCGSLCASGTMLRQSQGPRRVPREHAECFLSIVRHMNGEQRYH